MKTEYWEFLHNYEDINGIADENNERNIRKRLEEILSDNYRQIKLNILNLPHKKDGYMLFRTRYILFRNLSYIIFASIVLIAAVVIYLFRNWSALNLTAFRINVIITFIGVSSILLPLLILLVNKTRKELLKYLKYIILNGGDDLELPIPQHLEKLLIPFGKGNRRMIMGKIRCGCEKESSMRLIVNTTSMKEGLPQSEFTDVSYIKAHCINCDSHHLIFDASRHGWKGYVMQDKKEEPLSFAYAECPKCRCLTHTVYVTIYSPGKDLFIKESYLQREDGTSLREEEWVNAFSYILVNAVCANCNKRFLLADCSTL